MFSLMFLMFFSHLFRFRLMFMDPDNYTLWIEYSRKSVCFLVYTFNPIRHVKVETHPAKAKQRNFFGVIRFLFNESVADLEFPRRAPTLEGNAHLLFHQLFPKTA